MKKKIIIFALLLFLTGCTTNYDLVINKDNINETISGTVTKKEYNDNDTSFNNYYSLLNEDRSPVIGTNDKYTKNIYDKGKYFDYNYNYIYNGNFDKSAIINSCFENHDFIEHNDYLHIKLSGNFYCLFSKKINVSVTSNMAVLNHNAKKVDGKTYKWVINDPKYVNIEMDISKNLENNSVVKKNNKFRIVGLVVFMVLFLIAIILYKNKNSDI